MRLESVKKEGVMSWIGIFGIVRPGWAGARLRDRLLAMPPYSIT